MEQVQRFITCNLRAVMKDREITLTDLAKQVGVSFKQVQKYSTGEDEMSLKILLEICRILNCSQADIYPEVEFYENSVNISSTLQADKMIYAWFVNKYLRKDNGKKVNSN